MYKVREYTIYIKFIVSLCLAFTKYIGVCIDLDISGGGTLPTVAVVG